MNNWSYQIKFRPKRIWHLAVTNFSLSRSLFLVFAALTLPTCVSKDECADFPRSLSEATKTGVNLKDTSRTNALDQAINVIEMCYKRAVYVHNDFEKSFERISIGSDGKYYIFFSFIGIEDDWLIFRVGQNGAIDSVFTYSPLSRFAVPD